MRVFKILTAEQWADLRAAGESAGAPVDRADGYVHLSAPGQVAGTAAKHFAGQAGLWLLALEAEALGPDLRWEPSRGGALFPHLYRPLRLADVVEARPIPLGPEGHRLPPETAG